MKKELELIKKELELLRKEIELLRNNINTTYVPSVFGSGSYTVSENQCPVCGKTNCTDVHITNSN